jgi:hypothetical protein
MIFSQVADKPEERKAYIVGTFFTGFGEHLNDNITQGTGTCVEWIEGGNVNWSTLEDNTKDMTVSLPLIFDIKLISKFGFGFTFGDLLTISMNWNYQDANHLYFGFSYIYSLKRWDFGASLLVFPLYIVDDELIAGKIDVSYWFIKNVGVTISAMFGGTTGWSDVRVLLFSGVVGISVKI